MNALTLSGSTLIPHRIPDPIPGRGEVLIRVRAAGITLTELIWYPTSHTPTGEPRTGAVPSHEFSGEIVAIGESVTGLTPGQDVYGMNDWFADGALAEYCVTRPEWIAPKPARLSHAEAASVPIGALTAWQGLVDRAKLQRGERVLVHGGAGAVGLFAIQLAHRAGAHVATTVSPRNAAFVQELGADQTIDYKAAHFEDEAPDMDVVFDGVGGETLRRSWSVLKPGGRMVTIAAQSEAAEDPRDKGAFFIMEANARQLIEIARLLDAGELRTFVDALVPLVRAPEAYAGTLERKGRGKIVVDVDSSAGAAH